MSFFNMITAFFRKISVDKQPPTSSNAPTIININNQSNPEEQSLQHQITKEAPKNK